MPLVGIVFTRLAENVTNSQTNLPSIGNAPLGHKVKPSGKEGRRQGGSVPPSCIPLEKDLQKDK
jgi:hypothetical protein